MRTIIERIEKAIEKELMKTGACGTEDVTISMILSDSELDEFEKNSSKLNKENYAWGFEKNEFGEEELVINWSEEGYLETYSKFNFCNENNKTGEIEVIKTFNTQAEAIAALKDFCSDSDNEIDLRWAKKNREEYCVFESRYAVKNDKLLSFAVKIAYYNNDENVVKNIRK